MSLIPFGLLDVRPLVSPATDVVFALPMPSVAIHCGPVAMFPPHVQVTHTSVCFVHATQRTLHYGGAWLAFV